MSCVVAVGLWVCSCCEWISGRLVVVGAEGCGSRGGRYGRACAVVGPGNSRLASTVAGLALQLLHDLPTSR